MDWESAVVLLVIGFNAINVFAQTDTPSVEYSIREKFRGRRSTEELYFRCAFENPNPLATYQVYWYLDGTLAFSSSAVMSKDMNETLLTEENGLKLNKKISCAVKTTIPGNSTDVLSQRSDDYFAGIQIDNTFLSIRRGGAIRIRLRLTVPFGCAYYSTPPIEIQNCVLNIQMVGLSHGNCTLGGRSMNNCGLSIRRKAWNDTHEFVITHDDDNSRHYLPYRLIQLKTGELTSNEIWSDLTLPSVQVYILDNYMSSTTCGKHDSGNQILHNSTNVFSVLNISDEYGNIFEIQTRREKSSGFNNRLCGLAARAGGAIFIIDDCQFPVIKTFKRCNDKAISVNVWKDSSRNFTEMRLLPGIRISVTEYIRNNEAFLVVYICQVDRLPVAEDILNEVSTNFFEMSENDINKLQALADGTFAVCACLWERPEVYFIDHVPLNNSTMCTNRNDKICSSKITDIPPFSHLCKIGERKSDWILVLKAIAGNGERIFDAWDRDLSKLSYCTPGLGCLPEGDTLDTVSPTSRHLTSLLIKQWDSLNIQKVKVELYSKGNVVMKLVFDGEETDYMNWFSSGRLLYSSYQDMHRNSVYNYFSINGPGKYERRFHVNSVYNGCPGDIGWLTVVDSETSKRCAWETGLSLSQFLYSKGRTMRNWNSVDIGNADTMAIYIFR